MIKVCALASGSNGNCYYIGTETEAVLIDIGISFRKLKERLDNKDLSAKAIKAIFISHEHSDHYRGAKITSKKLGIPVYLSKNTFEKSYFTMRPEIYQTFEPGKVINIGDIKVHSFQKFHDAIEPCSFTIEINNDHIGVFTDIGTSCENVRHHISKCKVIFLEANYDVNLLENGKYPAFLKRRVSSDYGHLSNAQAVDLIEKYANNDLSTIFLSHISEDNNRGEIALEEFKELQLQYDIRLTNRYAASDLLIL